MQVFDSFRVFFFFFLKLRMYSHFISTIYKPQ